MSVTCCALEDVAQVEAVQLKAIPTMTAESDILRIALPPEMPIGCR
jgi:hypothetical protein